MNRKNKSWIKVPLEEVFTAVLTAFFTALMFRVGMGMLLSIIIGLALTYVIRLFVLKRAIEGARQRFGSAPKPPPGRDEPPGW